MATFDSDYGTVAPFMVFYCNDVTEFSLGKIEETGKVLLYDVKNNVVYDDILPVSHSLKYIFSRFGFSVKQLDLDLYDSIDTYEMITLPLNLLFEKMDTSVGYNIDIYPLVEMT